MQLLLSLVFFASIAGFSCEEDSFKCYQGCAKMDQWRKRKEHWDDSPFLSICKPDNIPTPCNFNTTDSPLHCYQQCTRGNNLTDALNDAARIFNEYCAKGGHFLDALRENVDVFCTHWDAQVVSQNCSGQKGCDMTTCTLDKTVNEIAYAYSKDSVKYATSYVKLLIGALPEPEGLPVDKGCEIVYHPRNAANGLHATGVVITLVSIASLIRTL